MCALVTDGADSMGLEMNSLAATLKTQSTVFFIARHRRVQMLHTNWSLSCLFTPSLYRELQRENSCIPQSSNTNQTLNCLKRRTYPPENSGELSRQDAEVKAAHKPRTWEHWCCYGWTFQEVWHHEHYTFRGHFCQECQASVQHFKPLTWIAVDCDHWLIAPKWYEWYHWSLLDCTVLMPSLYGMFCGKMSMLRQDSRLLLLINYYFIITRPQ